MHLFTEEWYKKKRHCQQVEAKIYSRTDVFSDPRLQRSMHATVPDCRSNKTCWRWDSFRYPKLLYVVHGDRKSCPKIHCKTVRNFFSSDNKKVSSCLSIGLAYEPIPCCSSCQVWLATQYNTWLSDFSTNRFFFSKQVGAWTDVIFHLLNPG